MPRVQSYGARKVREEPLPNQRKDTSQAVPNADTFGAARGRGMAAFGDALGGASSQGLQILNRIADERAQQADTYAILEAHNRLTEGATSLLEDPQSGVLNVKGKAALDAPKYVREKFDALASDLEANLKTPRQKLGFAQTRAQIWNNTYARVEAHASNEFDRWTQTETAKGIENAANAAIGNAGDLRRMAQERDQGVSMVLNQAKMLGWGPEQTSEAVMNFNTVVHTGVLDAFMSQGDDRKAAWYYAEVKDQIQAPLRTKIEAKLAAASNEGIGLRASAEIWAKFKPQTDNDPVELDKMEEAARAMFGDDAKGYDATMKYLREKASITNGAQKERQEALVGGLWQSVAQGASLSQITHTDAYRSAPGRLQAQIADYIVNRANQAESRAAARESRLAAAETRAYTREQRAEKQREDAGVYMFYQYAKPEVSEKMTDAQVWGLLPQIGQRNVERLLEQRNKFKTDPAAVDDFRSDTAVLDGVLKSNNIDPNPPKTDKEGQAKIGFFLDQVAAEQRRVQSITKKKLTNQELDAIGRRILGTQVLDQGFFTNSTQPILNATIGDVPSVDKEQIRAAYTKRGVTPTDQQILRTWLEAQANKR